MNRVELKRIGKAAFKANYWRCVLVAFLYGLAVAGLSAHFSASTANQAQNPEVVTISVATGGVTMLLVLLDIFVFGPLEVGCCSFFRKNLQLPENPNTLKDGFSPDYFRSVGGIFLRDLFTFLWALLFIIPGIVKSYSYRLTPYLLADRPELSATEAIDESRRLMNGHKWEVFVLDLSFLGWGLLSVVTLGLVGLFYADPYIVSTNAALYEHLKEQDVQS